MDCGTAAMDGWMYRHANCQQTMCRSSQVNGSARPHLNLLRPQVGEGCGEELRDLLVHIGCIVGERAGPKGFHVPEGCLDGILADDAKQVVQDLCVHLEARLVERVCMAEALLFSPEYTM